LFLSSLTIRGSFFSTGACLYFPNILLGWVNILPLKSGVGWVLFIVNCTIEIIRGFKTFSARQINKLLDRKGCPLWQRNYYEHIIRNEDELNNIRQYILNNPTNWQKDKNNINP
jgi:hypothetical protein